MKPFEARSLTETEGGWLHKRLICKIVKLIFSSVTSSIKICNDEFSPQTSKEKLSCSARKSTPDRHHYRSQEFPSLENFFMNVNSIITRWRLKINSNTCFVCFELIFEEHLSENHLEKASLSELSVYTGAVGVPGDA